MDNRIRPNNKRERAAAADFKQAIANLGNGGFSLEDGKTGLLDRSMTLLHASEAPSNVPDKVFNRSGNRTR